MSFANLKKQSSLGSLTQKLVKEVEKMNTNESTDDRFWKPSVDKAGNGFAVIRFLPAPEGEELPWVKVYSHAFEGDGGWFIDNCPTTVGQQCPVCEDNRKLWNSGFDADKEIARKQKRKLSYYSNIYVVKDPANPQNEGRVFLYKYGKKIFDKVMASMKPEFEDETPINPFDLWQGANFKIKIKKVAGYWNYDSSEFASPEALHHDDGELELIWRQEHSLAAFNAPEEFKTYEQLQARLNAALGKGTKKKVDESFEDEDDSFYGDPTPSNSVTSFTPSFNKQEDETPKYANQAPTPRFEDEEDDALSYFESLARM